MKKLFTSILFTALALTATAQLAYNQAFTKADFDNSATTVKKQGSISWDNSKQLSLGSRSGGGFNYDDKYVDICIENGFSNSVSFDYQAEGLLAVTGIDWFVKESVNGSDWSASIWTSTSKNGSANVSLSKNTRYIRVCYSGNFAGFVKNLTVAGAKADVTYGNVEVSLCPSELPYKLNDKEFYESGSDTLSAANMFGLDSIVNLTINILSYSFTDSLSIEQGADSVWHEQPLYLYEEGEYVLYDSLTTELGCDSVFVLYLTVNPRVPTALPQQTLQPAATKVFRNGVLYIRRDDALFDLRGQRVE